MNKYTPLPFVPAVPASPINMIFNLSLVVMSLKNVSAMLRAMRQLLQKPKTRRVGRETETQREKERKGGCGTETSSEHNLYAERPM